jgi:hypothetical protein
MALDTATAPTAPSSTGDAAATTAQPRKLTGGEKAHLKALEKRIEHGLMTFREVGEALLEIRDKRLYRMDFDTFEQYCRARWDLDRGRAYQIMGAAEVVGALPPGKAPANEAQARELVPVFAQDPELAKRVWAEVSKGNEPITAPRIREAVRAVRGEVVESRDAAPTKAPPPTEAEKLASAIKHTTDQYRAWRQGDPHPKNSDARLINAAMDELIEVHGSGLKVRPPRNRTAAVAATA